ncbi:peptidoglycan-associated lipoprotein Pal [Shewanella sp. 202IG2-18]|uniref:peptidoglycan-associated lipoprotein Pal n=1 Tax=Parashewanella hymeniacidonis TaxID=2807618 RepID=UPI0019609C88|nr:peptidoglycan-associated lipoprotein Pal [Parashewanella hymeniacidonis]MBM7072536.1 peptidoglycan-associated lipoprotein Pal [Parashewanella hymeniacidonis]
MDLNKTLKAMLVALPVLAISACSSTSDSESAHGAGTNGTNGTEISGNGVETGSANAILTPEERQAKQEAELRQENIIFFKFDRSAIQGRYADILQAHGNYLLEHPNVKVLIEGHTDERGTPEYNIALGERRAKSVMKYLQGMGVQPSQMSVVSYGEEKPLDDSHTEAAFSKNRRAVLVY